MRIDPPSGAVRPSPIIPAGVTRSTSLLAVKEPGGAFKFPGHGIYGMTDPGGKRIQQDSIGARVYGTSAQLLVADGLGGHKGGAAASSGAIRYILGINPYEPGFPGQSPPPSNPAALIKACQDHLLFLSKLYYSGDAGTTCSLVNIDRQSRSYAVSHVGDSPVYLYQKRADRLSLLCCPHNCVFEYSGQMVLNLHQIFFERDPIGILPGSDLPPPYDESSIVSIQQLIRRFSHLKEPAYAELAQVSYAMGMGLPPELPEYSGSYEKGDCLLAASDGLSLDPDRIKSAFKNIPARRDAMRYLVEESVKNRAPHSDNVAAVLYDSGEDLLLK